MKSGLNDLGAFIFCSTLCAAGTWIFITHSTIGGFLGFLMITLSVSLAVVIQK